MMKGTKAVAGMNIKRLMFGICVAFVLLGAFAGVSVASAKTIYVPDDHARIQWAVDNASAGDTIIVRDGTYVENIDINKPHLTIKSENGSANCVVRAANSNGHVFEVGADHVSIIGFTTGNAWESAGIYLYDADYCNISNNIASNNADGILIWYSSNNTIANNNVIWNNHCGIWLDYSSNNNILSSNKVSNNPSGIELDGSSNNIIVNNIVSSNYGKGICLWASSNNTIANNNVNSNNGMGIYGIGIHLGHYSSNNIIAKNTVSNNLMYGIFLDESSNNTIYFNNFINNADNVNSYASTNIWNSTEKITYIYNGSQHTNYLGNYWSDYTGSDADEDGIGDTPYIIDGDKDNYPLMEQFENYIVTPVPNQPPVANFTYSPEKPVVNQSVTFDASSSYDPDGKIMNYEWDFGDGNITNTTHEIINHSYSEAGIYEVTLTVTDDKGAKNSTTKMVTVMPAPPSVSISTDKYEYTAGDIMLINITIKNPSERKSVKFLWTLDIDYDKHFTIIDNRSLLLPPHYDKTIMLRWKLPKLKSSFNASWHVAIFNKTTSELISEDHADWKYAAAKAKKTNVKELEKSVREMKIPF